MARPDERESDAELIEWFKKNPAVEKRSIKILLTRLLESGAFEMAVDREMDQLERELTGEDKTE